MKFSADIITDVPTNIITGFLGVGKTSTILHLLKTRPAHERWAVLVNEFGEIGVDGALLSGSEMAQQGVFVREVPGGCMCCTSGLPMQVALSQLLRKAKPDRLLIEPTGLGHPKEVLQTLSTDSFKGTLNIQKTLVLVDARQLREKRYNENQTFQEQLSIADVVIANKKDRYDDQDRAALQTHLGKFTPDYAEIISTEFGAISPSILNGSTSYALAPVNNSIFNSPISEIPFDEEIEEGGFVKAQREGQGYTSVGWRFASTKVFKKSSLYALLSGVVTERLKGVFITEEGCYAYNLTRETLTELPIESCDESRIEIIDHEYHDQFEAQLFDCLLENQTNRDVANAINRQSAASHKAPPEPRLKHS